MGIADIVAVVVSLAGAAQPTVQGFGTPMLATYFNPATHWQNSGQRIRFYPAASAIQTMTQTDGFSPTGPIIRAVEVALAAPTAPNLIAIGRRALPFTQILKLTFTDTTVGDAYGCSTVGVGGVTTAHTLVSTGVPATDAASFAALLTEATIGTITVSGPVITFTQTAGALTDLLYWSPNISIANATVDPGITADLVAIQAANTIGWYGLSLDSNGDQEVLAAAAWVEATGQGGKWGFFDSADTANVNGVVTIPPNVATELQELARMKSYVQQSNTQLLSWAGFGMAAQILGMNPGSYALSFKTLPGVIADTDQSMTETQQLTLNTASTSQPGTGGENGNWYKIVSGIPITFPGVTPGGRWVDQGIFADWLQANVQADLFGWLAGAPRQPLTDIGIAGACAKIKSRLKTGSLPPYGGIDNTRAIVVNPPPGGAAGMSTQDRNNRNLSGITASFFFTGAINSTELQIVGSP
jgi:Protein of unknown function (DUF3383)